ncbi:MAG: malto-oligosyltrehalose trehalohydrolase, partial [Deltaproteobacteria bacterium]|nr:malto-oligosyltrehalose trehalohydrolase [Deltaproteobacteria bacterium]
MTFRVYAPGARRMELRLAPDTGQEHRLPMPRAAESGFFERHVADAGAGTRYRLRRDERWPQADPASHFQPEGVFGASEVINHRYAWQHTAWQGVHPRDLVLYEVHVGAFSSEGTYAGVEQHLGHLRELGITGIKLMPLATWSGERNWGYDGVFHNAPFAGYGRPEQLQRLIDACHGHGIAVILDVVTNHFGPEGNPMWDMARPFFCKKSNTPWGPGPRFEREEILAYFDAMARHFRQHYRFDGLRLDAVDAIDPRYRHEHIQRLARALEDHGDSGDEDKHPILFLESIEQQHDLLEVKAQGTSVLQLDFDYQRSCHRLVTGEKHAEYSAHIDPAADFESCLREGFCSSASHGQAPKEMHWSTLVTYLVNHDSAGNRYLGQRLQALVTAETFRACTALLLLHPAVPYLFMGQEWATERAFHFFTDFEHALGRRVAKGREHGFREVDFRRCREKPPHPQSSTALEASTLDWREREEGHKAEHLAFTRELLNVRKTVRPLMSDSTAQTQVSRQGRC